MFLIYFFYNTKEINKLLIKQSYNDVEKEFNIFNNKYPNFTGNIIGDEYNNLDEETKKYWNEYREKIYKLKKIVINNLLNYCKNYPDDKISKNRFINEYKEYPYRLEQNIHNVILELE
jgi:hypothetical protein